MNSWWRAYNEAMEDPKLQRLPGELFKHWFNLMCLASKKGGVLPPLDDIAFALRVTPIKAKDVVEKLMTAGLLDHDGQNFAPHNWGGRQYKSDNSTSRVQKFRARHSNGKGNADETFHN